MTHGFQQQDPAKGFTIPKTAAAPQHGQKPDRVAAPAAKTREPRSFEPKPGR